MLTEAKIDEIVKKIVDMTDPLQVILFGSYATGKQRENSDLDLLVVVRSGNTQKILLELEKALISKDFSLDILLLSEEDFDKKRAEGWRIFDEIRTNGRILHAA